MTRLIVRSLAVLLATPVFLFAQAPGVHVEPKRHPTPSPNLMAAMEKLKDDGKLLSMDAVSAALRDPTPARVTLPPVSTAVLTPPQIAARARQSFLRIGWYFQFPNDVAWHLNVSDGYLLSADGVGATAYHVMVAAPVYRQAYIVALDADWNVYPITQVLAADRRMDAAVFRVGGRTDFVPLAINDQTSPGDAVYLFSDPLSVTGYFSTGQVNRFYWEAPKQTGDATKIDDVRSLRMDVSVDWAPGSSGAAVVDDRCNVVGHVSKISALSSPPNERLPPTTGPATTQSAAPNLARGGNLSTLVVLHEAAPIRGIRMLIDGMNEAGSVRPSSTPMPTKKPN